MTNKMNIANYMFRFRAVLLCCIVLASLPQVGSAQETLIDQSTGKTLYLQYFIGANAALGINLHSASFGALPGFPSCCSEYKDATSLMPVFSALAEIPVLRDLRVQVRLAYTNMSGTLKRQQAIGNEPVLADGPIPTEQRTDVEVEHVLNASMPMAAFEATAAYRVFDFFWLHAGLRPGLILSNSFDQRETLFTPEGYTFLDGSTIRNEAAGEIPDLQSTQFHAVLGLGYELLTKSRFSMSPEVRYYMPLTKVSSVNWAVNSFQLGVSLRYGIYAPKEPRIIRDTVVFRDTTIVEKPNLRSDQVYLASTMFEDSINDVADDRFITTHKRESYVRETPRPFTPELTLKFETVDSTGTVHPVDTIRVEELEVIENYPLLPQVFFPTGVASIDSTAQILFEHDQAVEFRPMDLTRNQIDVYRNLLNVIGYSMLRTPAATLSLVGCVDNVDVEKNDRDLAQKRAEAIKNYFVESFKIDPSRIKVSARLLPASPANPLTPDGQSENRRVEISSNDPVILEPVEFKDKDLIITPNALTVKPVVAGGQDIASWSASLKQGTSKLAEGTGSGKPSGIEWKAADGVLPKSVHPLVAQLTVSNEIGQQRSVADTIGVDYINIQLMKARQEGGKLIERYSLIVFEFNSAQLSAENQRVMDRVRSRIQPESKVSILGFADRQGNSEYNRTLARKRCLEAQRVLGLPDSRVTIQPVGSDRLLYDNNTPEGRSYSRTVQIEIETPVR